MDAKRLLEQFLGPDAARTAGDLLRQGTDRLSGGLGGTSGGTSGGAMGGLPKGMGGLAGGLGGLGGGLAAGGLLGLLLGSKSVRKMAGGLAGYGGAAALGALAYRAWRDWQQGQAPAAAKPADEADLPGADSPFLPGAARARDGRPFEVALVLAMVAAANADGHIAGEEQRTIFARIDAMGLEADAKALVLDALARPPSADDIALLAQGPEQGAELYLASRLAIDPDHPMERAHLARLAARLALPADLIAHLDRQAIAVDTPGG